MLMTIPELMDDLPGLAELPGIALPELPGILYIYVHTVCTVYILYILERGSVLAEAWCLS
jgi:hypothetical protein